MEANSYGTILDSGLRYMELVMNRFYTNMGGTSDQTSPSVNSLGSWRSSEIWCGDLISWSRIYLSMQIIDWRSGHSQSGEGRQPVGVSAAV